MSGWGRERTFSDADKQSTWLSLDIGERGSMDEDEIWIKYLSFMTKADAEEGRKLWVRDQAAMKAGETTVKWTVPELANRYLASPDINFLKKTGKPSDLKGDDAKKYDDFMINVKSGVEAWEREGTNAGKTPGKENLEEIIATSWEDVIKSPSGEVTSYGKADWDVVDKATKPYSLIGEVGVRQIRNRLAMKYRVPVPDNYSFRASTGDSNRTDHLYSQLIRRVAYLAGRNEGRMIEEAVDKYKKELE